MNEPTSSTIRSASSLYCFRQSFFSPFRCLQRAFRSMWWKTFCMMQGLHYAKLKFGPLQWVNRFLYTDPWLWPRGKAENHFPPCQLSLHLRIEFIPLVYTPQLSPFTAVCNNKHYKVSWGKPQLYRAGIHLECPYSMRLSCSALWPLHLFYLWKTLFKHYETEQNAQEKNGGETYRDSMFTQGSWGSSQNSLTNLVVQSFFRETFRQSSWTTMGKINAGSSPPFSPQSYKRGPLHLGRTSTSGWITPSSV